MVFNTQYLRVFIFCGFFISACQNDQSHQLFTVPKVLNSALADTISSTKYEADHIIRSRLQYAGKFEFSDVVDINIELRGSNYYKAHLDSYQYRELGDSIDLNGFEIYTDYEQSIKYDTHDFKDVHIYEYYPIFLVNSTSTDKLFYGKSSAAYGIQVAASEKKWDYLKPIEEIGYDHCGMGEFAIIVHPGEFIILLAKKYAGNFETTLQVLIRNRENIIVSHPFTGMIDEQQFVVKDSSRLHSKLERSNGLAGNYLFCGAFFTEEYWK